MPDAPTLPFRWDLLTPDNVGTLIDGAEPPRLWFADALTACTGKVLARAGDADLVFVGRSLDSMFDLLGGLLADTSWSHRPRRLPLSFAMPGRRTGRRVRPGRMSHAQRGHAEAILADLGLSPYALARRDRPVTFVDVVHVGSTFTHLYGLLRPWVDREREPWPVIRRKLRFVGVTARTRTTPHAFRWQQTAGWTRDLPARSVRNVSLHPWVWGYLGDNQVKLTRTYRPDRWLAEADGPHRGERTAYALAEALALIAYGRTRDARRAVVRAMTGEPAMGEPWLRSLVAQLGAR